MVLDASVRARMRRVGSDDKGSFFLIQRSVYRKLADEAWGKYFTTSKLLTGIRNRSQMDMKLDPHPRGQRPVPEPYVHVTKHTALHISIRKEK